MTIAPPTRRRRLPAAARAASPRRALGRVPPVAGLLAGGWLLLLLAWAFANPPFIAPDEPAHYLRAVAVADGELGGGDLVDVPQRLWGTWRDPDGSTCNRGRTERDATCVEEIEPLPGDALVRSNAGAYPPLYYLLPGLAVHAADDPLSAVRAGRVAAALVCFLFLGLAIALLAAREAERVSLLGPLVAVTPMALFVTASINTSGLEITAGIAFFAALLRLARDTPAPGWTWAALAAAGIALALSRSTGPLWIVLDILLVAALVGPRGLVAVGRSAPRLVAAGAGAVVAALVGSRIWEYAYGSEITQQGPVAAPAGEGLSVRGFAWHGAQQLERTLDEKVGVFGWLDTVMPDVGYLMWEGMVAGLVAVALVAGRRHERWVLVGAVGLVAAVTVLISATLMATTGMDVQGRHVFPFAVVVPLLAGEIVYRNRARLALVDPGALFAWFAVLAGAVHALAWYANGYRHAVGTDGPRFFLPDARWSPPLGWYPWLVVALAGTVLLALAAAPRPLRRRAR